MGAPVAVEKDVAFGRGGDTELLLDFYRPQVAGGPLPVVVFIHGGGWCGGEKELGCDLAPPLAARGYLCAAISYRKAPQCLFPAALEDCKCALRWLRARGAGHGADVTRIAALGYSAGAHLAAMVALTPGRFEGEGGWGEQSSAVACGVIYCGPSDLTVSGPPGLVAAIDAFTGPPDDAGRLLREQASPLDHASRNAPPLLLINGDRDDLVPMEHAQRLAQAMDKAGARAELVCVKGAGHRLDLVGAGEAQPDGPALFEIVMRFLDENLKARGRA